MDFNAILSERVQRYARRVLLVKSPGALNTLQAEVQAGLSLEPQSGVATEHLMGWTALAGYVACPAGGAGNYSVIMLEIPGNLAVEVQEISYQLVGAGGELYYLWVSGMAPGVALTVGTYATAWGPISPTLSESGAAIFGTGGIGLGYNNAGTYTPVIASAREAPRQVATETRLVSRITPFSIITPPNQLAYVLITRNTQNAELSAGVRLRWRVAEPREWLP